MDGVTLPRETTVLVIGGGPVGLVASGLLSQRGVAHVVVERRRETTRAPAAHVLRRPSMAIFERLGVGDEIRHHAPPLALDFVTWCATLGGAEIGRLDLRPVDPATGRRRAEPWTNCSQNVLEPILWRHADRADRATLVAAAECIGLAQRADSVAVRIRRDDDREEEVVARYVIAADGAGSKARRLLGVTMDGQGPLGRFFMVHFEADLGPWIHDRSGPLFWILNPESPGCLIVHDATKSHVMMMPVRGIDREEDGLQGRLAAALGVPVPAEIISVDAWSPHAQVASQYRVGRVFLAGDAAHRFPPTGGLGLNTGIAEVHDLVDRLVGVLSGGAPEERLDGYEAECRPVALANACESFDNMKRLGEIAQAIGPCADLPGLEKRLASMRAGERIALQQAIDRQASHFLSDGRTPGSLSGVAGRAGAQLAGRQA